MADRPEEGPTDVPPSGTAEEAADRPDHLGRDADTVDHVTELDAREEFQSAESVSSDRPTPEQGTTAAMEASRPSGWPGLAYDIGTSVLAVLLIGGFLFAVSGVWPPLVAVESGSMIPNMHEGDLVFVMEEHRFDGEAAVEGTGVVPAERGEESGYRTFGGYGDVIVYEPDGRSDQTPIIHRAMLWVEAGENWSDEVTPAFAGGTVCESDSDPDTDTGIRNCPAPHAGFITKGDNNDQYDQVRSLSGPVKPEWVVGTAELRLPGVGWIRLGSP
jgi:signal peptidase